MTLDLHTLPVGSIPREAASLDGLRALQIARLKQTLAHAYAGNPAYRAKWDAAGFHPEDVRTLGDLARAPFTTKTDLRHAYPFGFFAVPMDRVARIHASSGTTGKPVVVGYTRQDIHTWAGLVARSIVAAGGRPGDRIHIAYGYGLFTGGLGAHYGAEALGCTVIPVSGGQTVRQAQLIEDFRPDLIMVTPTYMLAILDAYRASGRDPVTTSLRAGLFGAEPWGTGIRAEIERGFRIDATDIYGLSEVMGPGVAQEFADTKDGPTVWEDHFLPEIVDPATGLPLPDGEPGELVFTSLSKQAMPVVRYRTRDLTRLMPGSHGPMRRIAPVQARTDDMLIVRGVNLFPGQIEEMIADIAGLTPHFHLEVSRTGRVDALHLRVERQPDADVEAEQVAVLARDRLGLGVTVVVEPSGTLPRSEGKARRVKDLRS